MRNRGISSTVVAAAIVVILIVIGAGVYFAYYGLGTGTKSSTTTISPFKIAVINLGTADSSWVQSIANGVSAGSNTLNNTNGKVIQVATVYSVAAADFQSVATSYVGQGYNMIIGTDTSYQASMLTVAKANPNVQFFCAVCYIQLYGNMGTWAGDYWKGQFLAGMLAGFMTKSNIVGWVTGFQFPPTVEGLNAFIAGAKMTNSNIRVLYSFAGSWYDPTKGAAAASTLIAQGADIVVGMGDGMTDGLVKQAASSGVHAIGYLYDEYSIAPNAIYSSTLWNSTAYFVSGIRAAMGGQIGYKSYTLDLYPDHIGYLAPYHGTVPDNVVSQLNTLFAKVYSGQLVEPYNTTLPAQG